MKTPDKIKKGLECCNTYNDCQSCPYDDKVDKGWGCCVQRNADALAYIQQLEAKLAEYEKPLVPLTNDLISRETVLEALRARGRELLKLGTSFEANIASVTALECVNIVKDAPAVDAAPVAHSEWIKEEDRRNHWHCKNCGLVEGMAHYMMHYCPNCGARMNKEEK